MSFGYEFNTGSNQFPADINNTGLLNPNEIDYLADFFHNPNNIKVDQQGFALEFPAGMTVEEGAPQGGHAQDGHGQEGAQGGLASGNYTNFTNQQDQQQTPQTPFQTDVNFGTDPNPTSEDLGGVRGLFALSQGHGQQPNTHEQHFQDPATAASWGQLLNTSVMNNQMPNSMPNSRSPAGQPYGQYQGFNGTIQPTYQHWQGNMGLGGSRAFSQDMNHFGQQGIPRGFHMQQPRTAPPMPTYGSDPNFANNGFIAPDIRSHLDAKSANLNGVPLAMEAGAGSMGNHMHALGQTNGRHGPTQAYGHMQSPYYNHNPLMNNYPLTQTPIPSTETSFHNQSSQRKRRPSQIEREDDAEYTPRGHTRGSASKRPIKTEQESEYDDPEAAYGAPYDDSRPAKRRKSSIANYGSPNSEGSMSDSPGSARRRSRLQSNRQNLTDNEKRRNHIRSEKQRRDLIKQQYDALDELVPALKNGKSGLSRADILSEICEYIQTIQEGNNAMERILADMGDSIADQDDEGDAEGDEEDGEEGGAEREEENGDAKPAYGVAGPSTGGGSGGVYGLGGANGGDAGG